MKHRSDSIYRDNEQLKLALEKAEIKIATVRSEVFTLERKCESQSKEIVRLHSSGYIFRTNVNAMDKRDHRINEKQTTFMEDTSCKFWK